MSMRFIITVDRSLLDSDPSNPNVVRVEDTVKGSVGHYPAVRLHTPRQELDPSWPDDDRAPVVRYGPQRQDGARVWIEADEWEALDG